MSLSNLEKARAYENEHKNQCDAARPFIHFTPATGWCNDPNGFSVFQGIYHLFYQYYPYDTKWGSMHWGHAQSKDLIHWDYLPAALAPDQTFDELGCFSGSAIELDPEHQLLIYTGCYTGELTPITGTYYQHQCIAIGDGRNYKKWDGNPAIPANMLPQGHNGLDFRDPKIWKENDDYYTIVSSQLENQKGAILVYRSEDAYRWDYVSTLLENDGSYGSMWECPDLFSLERQDILLISPMEMRAKGEFHAGHGSLGFLGHLDRKNFTFRKTQVQALEYGTDFYAATTLESPDGRRIMIAWLHNWAYKEYNMMSGPLFGQMILPRELFLKEGRLCQLPVRELAHYYGAHFQQSSMIKDQWIYEEGPMDVYDLTFTFDLSEKAKEAAYMPAFHFRIMLGQEEGDLFLLDYDGNEKKFLADRSAAGVKLDIVSKRYFDASPIKNRLKIRFLVDRYSIEIFINDGMQAATFQIASLDHGISLDVNREIPTDIEIHEICTHL